MNNISKEEAREHFKNFVDIENDIKFKRKCKNNINKFLQKCKNFFNKKIF
jgi:hypothetical protein